MDPEEYAKKKRQVYSDEIPSLLLKYIKSSRWHNLLDLGCGEGILLQALDSMGFLKGKNIKAVDISETRLNKMIQGNSNIQCYIDSACELNTIETKSIDFLISTQVIEHVPDDEAMIQQIRRIMRPQGFVYLSTIFKKPWAWHFYRCQGKWVLDPTHLREYEKESDLIGLLEKYRFQILENYKSLVLHPLVDPLLRIMKIDDNRLKHSFMKFVRSLKRPVPGYYNWEIVCQS